MSFLFLRIMKAICCVCQAEDSRVDFVEGRSRFMLLYSFSCNPLQFTAPLAIVVPSCFVISSFVFFHLTKLIQYCGLIFWSSLWAEGRFARNANVCQCILYIPSLKKCLCFRCFLCWGGFRKNFLKQFKQELNRSSFNHFCDSYLNCRQVPRTRLLETNKEISFQ